MEVDKETLERRILWQVANGLGERYDYFYDFQHYTSADFHKTLHVLELAYNALEDQKLKKGLSDLIFFITLRSEANLGVAWLGNCFVKTGAPLLDKALVNEPLGWLINPKYSTIYEPYQKGLKHYLDSEKEPIKLLDAITDMYEALESLSKVVTNRPYKDLSSNAELFISKVAGNKYHKEILKAYISYANEFRHAVAPGQTKRKPSPSEVENFIYLTTNFCTKLTV